MLKTCGYLLVFVLLCAVTVSSAYVMESIKCVACRAGGPILTGLVRAFGSNRFLGIQARFVCWWSSVPSEACEGYISAWSKALQYLLESTELSTWEICAIYMTNCGGNKLTLSGNLESYLNQVHIWRPGGTLRYPSPGERGVNVLHLADVHLDRSYQNGTPSICPMPLCCRNYADSDTTGSGEAGLWGDYHCDAPVRLIEALLQHLNQTHTSDPANATLEVQQLDYIMWTGDSVPHDGWKVTPHEVVEVIGQMTTLLTDAFPSTPVVPVLGNHDMSPINFFPPPNETQFSYNVHGNFSVRWLYDSVAEMWKNWLPENATRTFRMGGFYALDFRPGLRLIVLNTNFVYRNNLWVIMTARDDPYDQLTWFMAQLSDARALRLKCHIIGHVSPVDPDILPPWRALYHRIIASYSDVITAQFFSHTHLDEVQVYTTAFNVPYSVSYIAPSVTPWRDINPGYRVYHIDGGRGKASTWQVMDFERWATNLLEANMDPLSGPQWRHLYTASEMYDLYDLSPASWLVAIEKWRHSPALFDVYHRFLKGQSDMDDCDKSCQQQTLCHMVVPPNYNPEYCE